MIFLQQNIYSEWDRYCPLYKTYWMMQNIVDYYKLALKVIEDKNISWYNIKNQTQAVYQKISEMRFNIPKIGEEDRLTLDMKQLNMNIYSSFKCFRD